MKPRRPVGLQPQNDLERFYRSSLSVDQFKTQVFRVYQRYINGPFDREQDSFDARDYPRIWGRFQCDFDFNPFDN
jgi:hypothetical protein